MHYPDPAISAYAEKYTHPESELLKQLNRQTNSEIEMPAMLSGHLQGRLLSLISHLVRPKYILEIGTYTGYSALCLAEGLQADGKLHTIDVNEAWQDLAKGYFSKSTYKHKILTHLGDARKIIPSLKHVFDLVFIDADKSNYSVYFDLVIDKVPKGGIIMADNVLWSGKVLEKTENQDNRTKALIAYSHKIYNDPRVEGVLLPIRDGIMVARKV